MNILGIESSCDETAAAVVKDGREIVSSVIASQFDEHRLYGGVVPEIASRSHVKAIYPVVQDALNKAQLKLQDIDGIAVTQGPGLIGSLLVGHSFAKSLSFASSIPFVGIHHIEGHLASAMMLTEDQHYPALGLVVSGGHTHMYLIKSVGSYQLIGQTRDDAIGEAFDKGAKILELGFPGGPAIEKTAQDGQADAIKFPRTKFPHKEGSYEFSFSGIKTALAYHCRDEKLKGLDYFNDKVKDIAASYQQALVDMALYPLQHAIEFHNCQSIFLVGGVARNKALRTQLQSLSEQLKVQCIIPDFNLCTDNAVMIAAAGHHKLKQKQSDPYNQSPKSSFSF